MKSIKKMYKRLIDEEAVRYLFFGVLTTIVNFGTYMACNFMIGRRYYLISNVLSFFVATMFAFVTNKKFVFESDSWKWKIVIKECFSFISARIGTFLLIEEFGLWILVYIFKVDKIQGNFFDGILLAKVFLAFIAVVVNYILSKKVIFKKNETLFR